MHFVVHGDLNLGTPALHLIFVLLDAVEERVDLMIRGVKLHSEYSPLSHSLKEEFNGLLGLLVVVEVKLACYVRELEGWNEISAENLAVYLQRDLPVHLIHLPLSAL